LREHIVVPDGLAVSSVRQLVVLGRAEAGGLTMRRAVSARRITLQQSSSRRAGGLDHFLDVRGWQALFENDKTIPGILKTAH